jgi:hypothetical protein
LSVLFLMVLLAAVIGSSSLVAAFAWIIQRVSRLESASSPELDRLLSENAELRDQIESMRSDLQGLDERVDFTEKLLERKNPDALPG